MVSGRADPERDGVADYVRHLSAALRDAGEEILPVPVVGPREAAERLHALKPDLAHVQFAPSAFGFSARPGLLPDLVRGLPFVTTLHEYGWWSAPRWLPGGVWRPLERVRLWDRETWRFVPRSSAVITTNAGHSRVLQERFGRTAVQVPLAPNVEDLGPANRNKRPAAASASPPTPRWSPTSGSCTRSRACATSSRRWPGCAAPAATACTC